MKVLKAVTNDKYYKFTNINLLLSWADIKGRDGLFIKEDNIEKFNKKYQYLNNS